jgi:DNA-binding response OmpR family regulator
MPGRAAIRLKKILIVDDDASIREVLATQLSRLHYETVTAADGEEAVKVFPSAKPDLVLMDLMMPKMDGLEACQKMRALEKKDARTPILFLTARDTKHDKLSSTLSGGDDFITKPISLQELRERVEAALAHAKRK